MTPLHLNILTASGSTRRESFTQSPVKFGRAEDSHVVIEEPTASRHHGELRWEDDHWQLVNVSPNGTWVDGREVGRRGVRLAGGEIVAVGQQPLFTVILLSEVVAQTTPEDAAVGSTAILPRKPKRRVTVWAAIGAYLVLMLALMIFVETLGKAPDNSVRLAMELTPQQIQQAITGPVTVPGLDPSQSKANLQQANQAYNQIEVWRRNVYEAYHHYRLALAYAGRNAFEPGDDQLRYQTVERRLIDEVQEQYHDAYERLRGGDYAGAEEGFRRLNYEIYPAGEGLIHDNVETQRQIAVRRLKPRRAF